ncbi:MAG: hypothetical protein IBX71_07090 [Candidatus Desulforudis sp.]|nr:hypothetical protein [Desulforudis sp.]
MLFTNQDNLVQEDCAEYSFRAQNDYTSGRLWVFEDRVRDSAAFADRRGDYT